MSYKIGIGTILETYRQAFPSDCLLLNGFLERTQDTKDGTIMIAKDGTFYYNPVWCKEWLTNPARFKDALMHEIGHPILIDTSREASDIANVSADAVINAMNFRLGLSSCELQVAMYSPTDMRECIMRPKSKPPIEVSELYCQLYGVGSRPHLSKVRNKMRQRRNTPGQPLRLKNPLEVTEALRIVTGLSKEAWAETASKCIGSHCPTHSKATMPMEEAGLPQEVVGDLADTLEVKLNDSDNGGGHYDYFNSMMVRILRTRKTLRQDVVSQFAVKQKINKIQEFFEEEDTLQSPVPSNISRRDAFYLATGYMPPFFSMTNLNSEATQEHGLHVYVDVSGSVSHFLPRIIGVLSSLRENIEKIYCFSNMVWEVSMPKLRAGKHKIKSTGGTDFDCVIEHAVSKNIKKCLVFTDGYAGVKQENKDLAIKEIPKMGVIYIGTHASRSNWIQEHYGVGYTLEELLKDPGDEYSRRY